MLLRVSIRKVKTFYSLSPAFRSMVIEAYFYLVIAYLFIRIFSFKKFSALLFAKEIIYQTSEADLHLHRINVSKAVLIASKYTIWKSKCYDQAIAAKLMLDKRKVANILHIGTASEPDGYLFHAWVSSQGFIITGGGNLRRYTEIARFPNQKKHL